MIFNLLRACLLFSALLLAGCGSSDNDDPKSPAVETEDWFADSDGDGFGDPAVMVADLFAPTGFVADNTDCDDSDASRNPGAFEIANGKDDDCDGITDLAFYYVFASSVGTYTGDFAQFDPVTNNGLTGADNECQRLANASPLTPGIYKAWLSDSSAGGSAAERLTKSPAPYQLPGGGQVAADWADFTKGTHDAVILMDEAANVLSPKGVYTGTDFDGASTGINCTDWSSALGGQTATTGIEDQNLSANWTNIGAVSCNVPLRLYCIQQ